MAVDLHHIKAVSFDLDDTLWDCASAIEHAESTCYRWLVDNAPRVTQSLDAKQLLARRSLVLAERPELVTDVSLLRKTLLQQTLAEYDYPADVAHAAFDVFYRARSEVRLYDGCLSLLEAINGQYQVAAITNGNADLSIAGIDHYFDSVHKADLANPAKPDRHMFDQCLSQFGINPEQLLHIGDNPETDVAGAQALGIKTVWFNSQEITWPQGLLKAQYEVKSLAELQQLLLNRTRP